MDMEDINNYLPEEWSSNPDDFMDLFQLDNNLLFNDAGSVTGPVAGTGDGMNDITSSLLNNLHNGFTSYEEVCGLALGQCQTEQALSPMSSLASDQEFRGFPNSGAASLDGSGYEDDFVSGSPQEITGSPAVKMETDDAMNEFSIFERNAEQQALSSAASDSGLSSDHLDFDPATDYEALSPALSSPGPSISERGGQNSPPRYVKQLTPQPIQKPQAVAFQQTVQTVAAPTAPSVVKTEKVQYQTVKTVIPAKKTPIKNQPSPAQFANGKEVKIYRVAPAAKSGQTVTVANGSNANKKVTLQLKNGTAAPNVTAGRANGTVFINNKNVVLTSAPGNGQTGVRKIYRVQQQQQQNGRSILVPVSIQDLRTIKIVNSANLKTKSANIKLAAANLLQQSKQGLIQKNVVLPKEQLIVDDSDATQNASDNESFVFEDIMQQSNSVIEQVQQQQQQQQMVSDSDAELDQDDDLDGDDSVVGNGKTASGGYQKLVLTTEEKRLLAKEGISLPTSYPLTKHEERELKRIRRKIRNKISAQDSRKRKKEYVDGLEERVKQCTEENQTLLKRIKILQSQNHDLMSQMKKIQSLLTKGTGKTTQPATCLMVLLLSMALVAVPNLKLGSSPQQQNIQDSLEMAELLQDSAAEKTQVQTAAAQSRRSLLFDTKEQLGDALVDEEMNFDEIMAFNVNSLIASEHDYSSEGEPKAKKAKVVHSLVDYDVDDDIWNGGSKMRIKLEAEEVNDKSKHFQTMLEQKMNQLNSGLQNIKTEHSEVIVDRELLETMSGKGTVNLDAFASSPGLLAKDGHSIDLLVSDTGSGTTGSVDEIGRKLNASQQIQQQNNKRKLLL
ncbi:uncharacterized protein LOC128744461 isoform X2 [Sabethes cyaneus]|uniref:uncharacterized protein LOC128744461 isoform X2 n=1 Tax=Sabethes cyaneus TaxID=53552 RepID=UPI00237DA0C3|nr:uncharacterized protein LOC128744461 isoform X2 [Sabethes cyaneus]